MKSLILATVLMGVYAGVLTLFLRVFIVRERAALMTVLFLLSVPVFSLVHYGTPADLGFLAAALTERNRSVDLCFGLLVYFAGFFGGILQVYNLADRGLSLRMLIDAEESGLDGLTAEEMMMRYGAGQGIEGMYAKRISDMLSRGLVSRQGNSLCLTERGYATAKVFGVLRRFLRLDV